MIEFNVNNIRTTRKLLFGLAGSLSIDQLNKIPEGFRNNVAWHLGHVIAVQQGLCYQRAGQPITVSQDILQRFQKGTVPVEKLSEAYIKELKSLSIKTLDELEADYAAGVFADYKPYANSFGYQMHNIEEVLGFLPIHEGIHLGYVMSMCHCL